MIHHVTRATRLLIFWSLIAGAVGLTFLRVFLAGVESYKTELEQKFHEMTGIQLRISALSAGTRGINPEIILHDIDILSVDEKGEPAVTLREVRLGVDVLQFLFSGDVLSSSRLSLVGAKVSVIRQEDGSLTIKGLNAGSNKQPLWLVRGGKYEILQSEISWQDRQRLGEAVTFNNFDLLIKNNNGHHEIHLLSDLPDQYGESIRVSADFDGNILDGEQINGRLYLEGYNIQFPAWLSGHLPEGIRLNSGTGTFQSWSNWRHSRANRVDVVVHGKDFQGERESVKSLKLDKLDGFISWESSDSAWRIGVVDLVVAAGEHHWPAAAFFLGKTAAGNFSAWIPRLDLQEVSYAARFIPNEEQLKELPKNLELSGTLQDFAVYASDDLQQIAVNGLFADISLDSVDGIVKFQGLSGQILGSRHQGSLYLASESGGRIAFPAVFRNGIDFNRIAGKVSWQQDLNDWSFYSEYLAIANADFNTYSKFTFSIPHEDRSAFMDLQMSFEGVSDVTRVPNYLPAKIMGKDAVEWLDRAFIAGHVSNGGLLLSGNLKQFPFTDGDGKFEVMFGVDNGVLSYHPEWPHLTDLKAGVHFFSDSLEVDVERAESENVTLKQATVKIPKLSESELLLAQGIVTGRISDGLKFMQKTPLHSTVEGLLANTEVQGTTDVELDLEIPLIEGGQEKVDGVAHVKNAGLKVTPVDMQISQLSGDLLFTESGLFCERLDGHMLGYSVRGDIVTDKGSTRIRVLGKTDLPHLQQQFAFLQNNFVVGELAYTAILELPIAEHIAPTLKISSDLSGVAVDLPVPIKKSADQTKLLLITMHLPEGDGLPLTIHYGDELHLALEVDKKTENVYSGQILLGKGATVASTSPGLALDIAQAQFDFSDWYAIASEKNARQSGKLPPFNQIDFNIGQAFWSGRSLGKMELAMKRIDRYWQGNLNSPLAKGAVRIPADSIAEQKIALQMASIDLSGLSELDIPVTVTNGEQLPLVDIFSEQLFWQGVDLGRLELETIRKPSGIHFNRINLQGRDSRIELTGDWRRTENAETTQVQGHLSSQDFGRFLGRLGYNDDLKETDADIDFSGGWSGSPTQFSVAAFEGKLHLLLKGGRISSIEPGFGRLLGLIAMEQWVKRFTLDFTDIYKKGLAFNTIRGNLSIDKGKALTNDLLIDAISARVKITGEADLLTKTLNHNVLVVPKSSDAVPIAGTIVGGIASIVTRVLTDDYKEGYFFGSEYKVEGPWGNVEITPLHDRDGLLKKTWTELTDFPWLQPGAN